MEKDTLSVDRVTNAEEGLDSVTDSPPDCIVSEYNLPETDGVSFLQDVRAVNPEVPFILYTGDSDESVASEAVSAGVTDYLQKDRDTDRLELLANRIKNAAQARRADRRQELMRLTEFAGDAGGFELDTESGEILLTDGAERILGLGVETDQTLENGLALFHPEDREEIRETVNRAQQSPTETQGTWRYQHPDGEQRVLTVTFTPTASENATTLRGAVRDVTKQRERQDELASERQFIAQALETLEDLFYVVNVDGTLQRWNGRVPEVTGYTECTLEGMPVFSLFAEDERDAVSAAIEAVVAGKQITLEADVLTADGQRIPYEFTGTHLTDADGETLGVVGIGRDLTERRRRERRFEALVEKSSDIISVVDTEGRYQYQSPSLERILGYTPGETIGDFAWDYIHPDDREAVMEEFERLVTAENSGPIEYRARHANGSWRWMEARGNEQLDGATVDGFVINSRDITERKRQKKQVEVLDRVLRHNLRNKMNVIRSQAETIQSRGTSGVEQRAAQIVETSDRLVEIAEKEREITELVRKEPTYREKRFLSVFRRVVSVVENTQPDARLTVDCPPELTARVPAKFEDAVNELVTNAIVHDDSQSPDVGLTAFQTEDGICIEIADTGPPIPETERELLADETERTQLCHGDGLGLLLVKEILSEAGGTVTVRENDPRGNIVRITLPE